MKKFLLVFSIFLSVLCAQFNSISAQEITSTNILGIIPRNAYTRKYSYSFKRYLDINEYNIVGSNGKIGVIVTPDYDDSSDYITIDAINENGTAVGHTAIKHINGGYGSILGLKSGKYRLQLSHQKYDQTKISGHIDVFYE